MTAKEYLNNVMLTEQNIKAKTEQISALKDIATNCTSHITGMPKANHSGKSGMADAVCRIADLKEEIEAETLKLTQHKIKLLELISKIEAFEQQTVLLKRYFNLQSWEDIAHEMHYSLRWIHMLHSRALIRLNEIFYEEGLL